MDKSLLNDATTTDDAPTPGFIIVAWTGSTLSSYAANTQLQEFLISRLKKDNHNVKYKCLVIVKHVCRTGRPEFKREMARHVDAIKECLQYRGPPDPLRGDEIYRRVRDIAKEALDAIFDSQMPVTTSAVATSNRIQGMGGGDSGPSRSTTTSANTGSSFFSRLGLSGESNEEPAYSGHPGASGDFARPTVGSSGANDGNSGYYVSPYRTPQASAGGMVGFGNTGEPAFSLENRSLAAKAAYYSAQSISGMAGFGNSDPGVPLDNRSLAARAAYYSAQSISAMATGIASSMTAASGSSSSSGGNKTDFGGYATNRGPNAYSSSSYTPQTGAAVNGFSSKTTGVWGNSTSTVIESAPEPGSSAPGSIVPDIPKLGAGLGRAGGAAADGEYERAMIEGLCEPAGLKVVPAEDKLEAFLVAAQTLSPDLVGPCLVDILNSESWQSRTKALIVINSLAKAKGCFAHNMWWVGHAEELIAMANDPKTSVRTQANKCLRALKISNPSVSDANPNLVTTEIGTPGHTASATGSLLDDSDFYSPPGGTASANQPVSSQAAISFDGGMGDMFAGMSVSGAPAAPPVAAPSLLDSFTSPPPSVPTVVPTNIQSLPQAISAFDFLDSGIGGIAPVTTTQPQPPSVPVTSTMSSFDFLDTTPSIPPPAPGSNFLTTSASVSNIPPVNDLFGSLTLSGGPSSPLTQVPPSFQQSPASVQSNRPPSGYGSDFAGLDASPLGQAMYAAYGSQPARPMAGVMGMSTAVPGYGTGGVNFPQQYAAMPGQVQLPQNTLPGSLPPNQGYRGVGSGGIPPAPITSPGSTFGNSMTSVTANRKVIPDATREPSGGSGFSFMGGGQPSSASMGDAFSFIQDEVKASAGKR